MGHSVFAGPLRTNAQCAFAGHPEQNIPIGNNPQSEDVQPFHLSIETHLAPSEYFCTSSSASAFASAFQTCTGCRAGTLPCKISRSASGNPFSCCRTPNSGSCIHLCIQLQYTIQTSRSNPPKRSTTCTLRLSTYGFSNACVRESHRRNQFRQVRIGRTCVWTGLLSRSPPRHGFSTGPCSHLRTRSTRTGLDPCYSSNTSSIRSIRPNCSKSPTPRLNKAGSTSYRFAASEMCTSRHEA